MGLPSATAAMASPSLIVPREGTADQDPNGEARLSDIGFVTIHRNLASLGQCKQLVSSCLRLFRRILGERMSDLSEGPGKPPRVACSTRNSG